MCGVAGILRFGRFGEVNAETLTALRDHMASRGPDGAGNWFADDRRTALAHRRLSIIDPGESGHQPMTRAGEALAISFNGEIYNYRALRDELANEGARFATGSDTEVLLALYERNGLEMVQSLRGMYAFALFDQRRGRLVLGRDPYGIKPLYYASRDGQFLFASQVGALASVMVGLTKDPVAEASFLMTGSVMEPRTYYREISALPAGCLLSVDRNGVSELTRHSDISAVLRSTSGVESADDPQQRVRTAVLDSVDAHLEADVPVGSFLSAGIDSAVVSSVASGLQGQPPTTLTLGFDSYRGGRDDEVPLARILSREIGSHHLVHTVGREEFDADLESLLAAMDQPTIDGVNTWFVSKAAAAAGMKVMLSGIGGDELFGGYPSFGDLPRWQRRLGWLAMVPGRTRVMSWFQGAARYTPIPAKALGLGAYADSLPGSYLVRRGLFMPWELGAFMGAERAAEALLELRPPDCFDLGAPEKNAGASKAEQTFRQIATMESCFYLRNQLLRDTDWTSMAHGLEVRTPLVDHVLAQQLISITSATPGKVLLAGAPSKPLPDAITARAKTGFTTPIADWMIGNPKLSAWKSHRYLQRDNTHWSRRYAATIHSLFFKAGG